MDDAAGMIVNDPRPLPFSPEVWRVTDTPEPMSDERLAEIEAEHADDGGWCAEEGQRFPCSTIELVAEVKRLRRLTTGMADLLKSFPEPD